MSVITDAQAADFLKRFEGKAANREKAVMFPPIGAEVYIRAMGLGGRLISSARGEIPGERAAMILEACVYKIDHKTEARVPFADAATWDAIADEYPAETTRLLVQVLDLSSALRSAAEKKSETTPQATSHSP